MDRENKQDNLASIVARLHTAIHSEGVGNGGRAALRKADPSQPLPMSFYRFAAHYLPDHWENNRSAWICLVSSLANIRAQSHDMKRAFGAELAKAGYTELRMNKLLSAKSDMLEHQVRQISRLFQSKAINANWVDPARLLLAKDNTAREAIRQQLATDYYKSI